MGFRDVQRAQQQRRGVQNEQDIQSVIQAGGQPIGGGQYAISGGEGPHGGDANFYNDPLVNSVVKLPSEKEAEQYTGASPSFHGVQRPGDWQRVVQRQMAEDAVGKGALNRAGEARVRRAQFGSPQ